MFDVASCQITKKYFDKSFSGLSETAQKQINKFMKNGVQATNVHAIKLIKKTEGIYNSLKQTFKGVYQLISTMLK